MLEDGRDGLTGRAAERAYSVGSPRHSFHPQSLAGRHQAVRPWCLLAQDIATSSKSVPMADKEPRQPTHRAYSVIRREGQDDYWLNIGLVFPHKDNGGFNIMLQAFPLDGKIVCREITAEGEEPTENDAPTVVPAGPAERHRPRQALNGRPSL